MNRLIESIKDAPHDALIVAGMFSIPDSFTQMIEVSFPGTATGLLLDGGAPGNRYWGALSLSAMMARARWVRSSFSLGVNRMSPLTQRLISRVAISVMRICSPRSVMEMAPAISIACWHSRMDIVGGEGGMRGRSASSMMARDFLVSSSWLARGSRISPQTQCVP